MKINLEELNSKADSLYLHECDLMNLMIDDDEIVFRFLAYGNAFDCNPDIFSGECSRPVVVDEVFTGAVIKKMFFQGQFSFPYSEIGGNRLIDKNTMHMSFLDWNETHADIEFTFKSFSWIVKGELTEEEEKQYEEECVIRDFKFKYMNLYNDYSANNKKSDS